ncbi:hypothetical protein C241_16458 [Bradyrhizobium lupini HPC(L)]|uniref:Uncharacterized protein n=1 Tax=Bradyrhizobium lupini HPC(L) TaxID=1229491 RepID=A0ABN0HJS3_RHILU|nr:hypothetical protein C241_16458 [Bradyrhizobium lupini HPC(L)]
MAIAASGLPVTAGKGTGNSSEPKKLWNGEAVFCRLGSAAAESLVCAFADGIVFLEDFVAGA